jgi:hypothetical protein
MLGFVGFKAVSMWRRRDAARPADVSESDEYAHSSEVEPRWDRTSAQGSGGNAVREERGDFDQRRFDEELEPARSGRSPGDAYDAVATDDLAAEWLSRATEAGLARNEPLNIEAAEALRDAAMSVVSEGSLNSASVEQFEAVVAAGLDGLEDSFELEFDHSAALAGR